jgi:iron complex outermembrane receptor protein
VPPSYANESSKSYEIGVKGKVAPRIYLTTAAYLTNTSDLIVQTDNGCAATNRSCPTLATSFLTNAGKARTWGVEVELLGAAKVAGGDLRFSLRGSRQQGKVTSGQYDGAELPQVPTGSPAPT